MAVYTRVSDAELGALLARYDIGTAVVLDPIAEGVENSNFRLTTTGGCYALTLYEKRVAEADLPFFLGLMGHAARGGVPAPLPVADRAGTVLQTVAGRRAAIVGWLVGTWPREPTEALAYAAGAALARLHRATEGFGMRRANALGPDGWRRVADACGAGLDGIAPELGGEVEREMAVLAAIWPIALPHAAIHADLFPDNLLFEGGRVTGVIDFYFACTDVRAYDLAVMLGAWCFSADGTAHLPAMEAALLAGYGPLAADEAAALPVLARGAALRFLLTRAYDWINTPADAEVTRKDPLAYLARLRHFRSAA